MVCLEKCHTHGFINLRHMTTMNHSFPFQYAYWPCHAPTDLDSHWLYFLTSIDHVLTQLTLSWPLLHALETLLTEYWPLLTMSWPLRALDPYWPCPDHVLTMNPYWPCSDLYRPRIPTDYVLTTIDHVLTSTELRSLMIMSWPLLHALESLLTMSRSLLTLNP